MTIKEELLKVVWEFLTDQGSLPTADNSYLQHALRSEIQPDVLKNMLLKVVGNKLPHYLGCSDGNDTNTLIVKMELRIYVSS